MGKEVIKRVDKKYREWIIKRPCAKCHNYIANYIAPAHQRILGGGGMGYKPHDKDLLPLCTIPDINCHGLEHRGSVTFWEQGTKAKTKKYVQQLCNEHLREYDKILK